MLPPPQAVSAPSADFNADGVIDAVDLQMLLEHFGERIADHPDAARFDLTHTGVVSRTDLADLLRRLGHASAVTDPDVHHWCLCMGLWNLVNDGFPCCYTEPDSGGTDDDPNREGDDASNPGNGGNNTDPDGLGTNGDPGTGDPPPPPPPPCAFDLNGPKAVDPGQSASFSVTPSGETGETVTWTVINNETLLDAAGTDAFPHSGESLNIMAGMESGVVTLHVEVVIDGDLCERNFKLAVIKVNLTAHRPSTEYFDFTTHTVPDGDEEIPGAGIRFNGDDDNNNNIPDNAEDAIPDDDLVKVDIELVWPPPTGIKYIAKRSNANIKVWLQAGLVLDGTDEEVLDFDATTPPSDPTMIWVESVMPGMANLSIEARDTDTDEVYASDKIVFYSFESIAVALTGENSALNASGIGPIALELYDPTNGSPGYDVHYYDEDSVASGGAGGAFNQVADAIRLRGVTNVALFGHSHGGGSVFCLAQLLATPPAPGIPPLVYELKFTGYIDAIENTAILGGTLPGGFNAHAETKLPPGTFSHLNYWENQSTLIHGAPTAPPGPIVNIYVNNFPWGANLTHGTIDNSPVVQTGIETSLRSSMPTP